MESLTSSASQQGNTSDIRNANPVKATNRSTTIATEAAAVQNDRGAEEVRAPAKTARVEAQGSAFQARLNYDQEEASVFVEILDPATGDVIRRLPAESAAEQIRELTGGYGGTVVDRIA